MKKKEKKENFLGLTQKKDALFIIGYMNAKVGS